MIPTTAQPEVVAFKVCTMCGKTWANRDEFLADPAIRCIGYQVHFEDPELGLFDFNHETCGTTLMIKAFRFSDLYDGPKFTKRLTGTDECPGYCLHRSELRPCPAQCICAYVRSILDTVAYWEKADLS